MALMPRRQLCDRAQRLIPGGVNSPVRAMRAVGSTSRSSCGAARAPYIEDVGRQPLRRLGACRGGRSSSGTPTRRRSRRSRRRWRRGTTFGAPTEGEVELAAEIVDAVPSIEMVRLVSSGTEATMSAVRLARAATRRDRLIKFAGNYHGHVDALLASAGSGVDDARDPVDAGRDRRASRPTRSSCPYNDIDAVAAAVAQYGEGLAAIIVEPVAGNMGVVPPAPGVPRGAARCSATRAARCSSSTR